ADAGAGALLGAAPRDVAAVEKQFTLRGRELADDRLHQRGLAGAIAAQHGDTAAPWDADVDVEQHLAAAITGLEMPDIEECLFKEGGDRSPGHSCWPGSPRQCRTPAPCPGRAR